MHPLVRDWFNGRFPAPTEAQRRGWPAIAAGRDTLIAAPTGSGKTLAAFLHGLDGLLRSGLDGTLPDDAVQIVYVSPLKALGNDVQRNLLQPLEELRALATARGLVLPDVRVQVRSGDTTAKDRAKAVTSPPHILITTPESLYIVLTAERSRERLRHVQTVIVDEIHALAGTKRGAHLALTLERLESWVVRGGSPRPVRIGLSATQKPIERVGRLLVGAGREAPVLVDQGHLRRLDLAVEVPEEALQAAASQAQMEQLYDRVAELVKGHRSTLVFTNTRRLSERVAHNLGQRLGPDRVAAHHGALAKEKRLATEQRLKAGTLSCVVSTASLELGIDIGDVDLVVQLGSPQNIATLLQRVGRAGHSVGGVSKGRLFAQTRDQLVECAALMRSVRRGELDALVFQPGPLDVLAQQLVAECAAETWDEGALFALVRHADPYADLTPEVFEQVLSLHAEGVSERQGRRLALLHRDETTHTVRGRRGARLRAITSGGAIPDRADYQVVAEPEDVVVGTVDEDFAIESVPGDVFLLGSQSWRIRRVEPGRLRVEPAPGVSPSVPFWFGEAPARSHELSLAVGQLRGDVERALVEGTPSEVIAAELSDTAALSDNAARQLVDYLNAARLSLGALPTDRTLVIERFFDEAGGMQLVLHSPLGGRINRAWGLALRKCFCRTFDFELQAAATDDGIVLSLGAQHSFPLESVLEFVRPESVERVLTQALLTAPGTFGGRWRWVAQIALALPRMNGGKRVPAPIQRMRSEDLLAAVFPQQQACFENIVGDIEPPDHPLVNQVLQDCLNEAMDLPGLQAYLVELHAGRVRTLCLDTTEPSVLGHELLNSSPWSFLDNAPLEERRTRAVNVRRSLSPEDARNLAQLDPEAIATVETDLRYEPRNADELHDLLLVLGFLPAAQLVTLPEAGAQSEVLLVAGRALQYRRGLVATERAASVACAFGEPGPVAPDSAQIALIRALLEVSGPRTAVALATHLGLPPEAVEAALVALESEGAVLRGRFTAEPSALEWCDRRVLARIHRLTIGRLRREIEPVSAADLMRFLFRWQHVDAEGRLSGVGGVARVVAMLQGYEAPAVSWERDLLPARLKKYESRWLDELCTSGELAWGRLSPPDTTPATVSLRQIPVTLFRRVDQHFLLGEAREVDVTTLSHPARDVLQLLRSRGPLFVSDLQALSRRLPAELEDGLGVLAQAGLVTADGFAPLRGFLGRAGAQKRSEGRRPASAPWWARGENARPGAATGRWSLLRPLGEATPPSDDATVEAWARQLLQRYGILFRDVALAEPAAPPWRLLYPHLRRLEARGEVRGGRFVTRFQGEQFALPIAVESLRAVRRRGRGEHTSAGDAPEDVTLSAVDPLNLTGLLTPGERIPAQGDNRVLYRNGVPLAARVAGQVRCFEAGVEAEAHLAFGPPRR